ncbi:conserved hypothetical protein (plasmid) [Borreliella afzelii ACA-1]|nr:conserved hypothetical protein [Borreliella afzelii ACA-1]
MNLNEIIIPLSLMSIRNNKKLDSIAETLKKLPSKNLQA